MGKEQNKNDNVFFGKVKNVRVRGTLYNPETKEGQEIVTDVDSLWAVKSSKYGASKIKNDIKISETKYEVDAWDSEKGEKIKKRLYAVEKAGDKWEFANKDEAGLNFTVKALKITVETPNGKTLNYTVPMYRLNEQDVEKIKEKGHEVEVGELSYASKDIINKVLDGVFNKEKELMVAIEFDEVEGKKISKIGRIYTRDAKEIEKAPEAPAEEAKETKKRGRKPKNDAPEV